MNRTRQIDGARKAYRGMVEPLQAAFRGVQVARHARLVRMSWRKASTSIRRKTPRTTHRSGPGADLLAAACWRRARPVFAVDLASARFGNGGAPDNRGDVVVVGSVTRLRLRVAAAQKSFRAKQFAMDGLHIIPDAFERACRARRPAARRRAAPHRSHAVVDPPEVKDIASCWN